MAGVTIGTSTIGTAYRLKYLRAALDSALRKALVAEKCFKVDRSDLKYIANPYGNQPTATVQSMTGTYSVGTATVTDENLTVKDEFIYSEHIYDFEEVTTKFNLFASRVDELTAAIATAIDKFVINVICEDGNATYSTPAGGFATAANIPVIMSNLISKVAGYADTYKGLFLIIENTDVPGFIQSGAASGFSFADAVLNNGWMGTYMGVDIYVVRSGTYSSETQGSETWTNANHRLFGVKGVATYASPRGIQVEEKMVSGKTGRELAVFGYCGALGWATKYDLLVDITIT